MASLVMGVLMVPGCLVGLAAIPLWGLGVLLGIVALRQTGSRRDLWIAWIGVLLNAIPLLLVASLFGVGFLPFAVSSYR